MHFQSVMIIVTVAIRALILYDFVYIYYLIKIYFPKYCMLNCVDANLCVSLCRVTIGQ